MKDLTIALILTALLLFFLLLSAPGPWDYFFPDRHARKEMPKHATIRVFHGSETNTGHH